MEKCEKNREIVTDVEIGCRGLLQDATSPLALCKLRASNARQTGLQLIEIEPGASELPLHQTARSNINPFTVNASNYWLILCSDKVTLRYCSGQCRVLDG